MAKKQAKNTDLEKVSFEQAIEELTAIVDQIETGAVPLQKSLEQYEKGMGLIKHCRAILLDAEKRIEEIGGDEDDDLDEDAEGEVDEEEQDGDEEDESLF